MNYHFIEEALRLVTANLPALSRYRPPADDRPLL